MSKLIDAQHGDRLHVATLATFNVVTVDAVEKLTGDITTLSFTPKQANILIATLQDAVEELERPRTE